MIVQHPTRPGWLIVTPEIGQIINAEHRLILPDGSVVHPLHFTESDILTVEQARVYGSQYLNTWRGRQRAALGLTSAEFQELAYTGKALECQRWQAAPESAFGLAKEAAARGLTNEAMATLALTQWAAWQAGSDTIEADYITARAAVLAAGTVEEIAEILAQKSPG